MLEVFREAYRAKSLARGIPCQHILIIYLLELARADIDRTRQVQSFCVICKAGYCYRGTSTSTSRGLPAQFQYSNDLLLLRPSGIYRLVVLFKIRLACSFFGVLGAAPLTNHCNHYQYASSLKHIMLFFFQTDIPLNFNNHGRKQQSGNSALLAKLIYRVKLY